ncbi:hypothetical protein PIB30_048236 [Stylosanthes scabra]|uniref:Uncharacterized protein n=1 Tax=Stylosanthes scabra TaxID=79078 RepID=A0ABU6WI17_9FABA|nr:hypothetical protein [Stylosanthes scabra]
MASTSHAAASIGEATAVEHINGLIAQSRQGNRANLTTPQRRMLNQWYVQNPVEVARLTSTVENAGAGIDFVQAKDWSAVGTWVERQATLRKLCNELGRASPLYHLQTFQSRSRGPIQRCIILIAPSPNAAAVTAAGRYSADEHLTREDGATEMICNLIEFTGKHVYDFNYDLLEKARLRISDLQWELGALQTRYRQMNEMWRSYRRARYSDISDSEWSEESD